MADTDVKETSNSRIDDIDVERILARVERRGPLTFSRKRCLFQAPEFVKRLSGEETVEEGSTVKFECKVVGFPKPLLTWFKDDEPLNDNPRIQLEVGENGSYAIVLEKSTKEDDGTYRCRAENAEGSSSSTLYLSIKAKNSPKKCHVRNVSLPSGFPTIHEKIDEEEKENKITTQQAESPLTHLYDNLSIKAHTMWPQFLGRWAFAHTDSLSEEDQTFSLDDVFATEDCRVAHVCGSDLNTAVNGHTCNTRDVMANSEHNSSTCSVIATTSGVEMMDCHHLTSSNQGVVQKAVKDHKNAIKRQGRVSDNGRLPTENVCLDQVDSSENRTSPVHTLLQVDTNHLHLSSADTAEQLDINEEIVQEQVSQDQSQHKLCALRQDARVSVTAVNTGAGQLLPVSHTEPMVGNLTLGEFIFAITGFTYFALQTGMAPTTFIICILSGLLLLNFLCWIRKR